MSHIVEDRASPPIPLFTPEFRGNEWQYVKQCLDTAWVSSVGTFVERFEQLLAEHVGTRYAVATVNGTAALHTALLTVGIGPDDEVLVPSLTFIATANAVRYCGAWPVFIDAEPRYWQMDPELVERFLTRDCTVRNGTLRNRQTGRPVRAILPTHVLGHPADMDPILKLARRYDLLVIEDAAEGLGVRYKDRPVGGMGHAGCLSFNGNKLITTGGGGMLVTNDEALARQARRLTTQAKDDPLEYIHGDVAYNYRLTNLQAAVGCGQMECLPEFLVRKQVAAAAYRAGLDGIPGISFYTPAPDVFCTYWMNTICVESESYGLDSRTLQSQLQAVGIQSRPLWQPLHLSPAHRGCQAVLNGTADRLYRDCLSIPSSVGLEQRQIERICRIIRLLHQQHRSTRAA